MKLPDLHYAYFNIGSWVRLSSAMQLYLLSYYDRDKGQMCPLTAEKC